MNDNELDQLLDAWEAPPPPKSLRQGLRARFPGAERRRFAHAGKWLLLTAAASATLAIGLGQVSENSWALQIDRLHEDLIQWAYHIHRLHEDLLQSWEAWRAAGIMARVRQSDPKVYVNGELTAPLGYGPAGRINVRVPGDGVYSVISFPGLTGWTEAGHIHGSVIEFMAGGSQVRIECTRPVVDSDVPVFVRRQP